MATAHWWDLLEGRFMNNFPMAGRPTKPLVSGAVRIAVPARPPPRGAGAERSNHQCYVCDKSGWWYDTRRDLSFRLAAPGSGSGEGVIGELIAQRLLRELADAGLGDFVNEHHIVRDLPFREPFGQETQKFITRECFA